MNTPHPQFTEVRTTLFTRSAVTVTDSEILIVPRMSRRRQMTLLTMYLLSIAALIGFAGLAIRNIDDGNREVGAVWLVAALVAASPTLLGMVHAALDYVLFGLSIGLSPLLIWTRRGRRRLRRWWNAPSSDDSDIRFDQITAIDIASGPTTRVVVRRTVAPPVTMKLSGPQGPAFAAAFTPMIHRLHGAAYHVRP